MREEIMIEITAFRLIVIEVVLFFLITLLVIGLVASYRAARAESKARRKVVPLPERPRRAA